MDKMFYMSESKDTTTKTLKGYTLVVEFHEARRYCVWIDPRRKYTEVARAEIPEAIRQDARGLDEFFNKIHRMILASYQQQHKQQLYGISLLPASILNQDELQAGVGLTRARARAAVVPASKITRRPKPRVTAPPTMPAKARRVRPHS